MLKTIIKNEIKEKIRKLTKGKDTDEQFNVLIDKFKKNYEKIEEEFDSEYMKQKYCFNLMARRYGNIKKCWILNEFLGIKNHWGVTV